MKNQGPRIDAQLLIAAREAAAHAYTPYSHFPVGAALQLSDGRVVTGCNVENASYGLTLCAERNACTTAVAEAAASPGQRGVETPPISIETVAIVGLKASPCYPCGACRQVLNEFGCQRVIVESDDGYESHPFSEILPFAFGPDAL